MNNSLSSFSYKDDYIQAQCRGRLSDTFINAVIKLHEAVLTKLQSLESNESTKKEIDTESTPCEGSAAEP